MSIARRRFRIHKEIAEGGFGKVYLAEQISSDGFSRIVAIKLLHAKWSSHDEVVKRTRDEARVLGRIRHQHIVKVEDLTSLEGKCAIVMEYLEGVDLKWMSSFLKEKGLEFPRGALFEIILAVASALDAAYNSVPLQGDQPLRAIHRDIKPSNIFVTVAGGVKVLDFGTARANFAEREAKTQALAFGSQGYMAPERMLGEEDTPAADIFSLGITLYELLTLESFGRIPPRPNKFQKKMDEKVASVPLTGDPEWVNQVRDTLRLMLSYAPADRPTAAQLVEIMDILAQEAGDTGLRRYCRTLVSEAKDALPALDTGDPLTGQIVDEDEFTGPPPVGAGDSLPGATAAVPTMPPSGPPSIVRTGGPAPGRTTGASSASLSPPTRSPPSPNAPVTGTLPPPPAVVGRTVNPEVASDDSGPSNGGANPLERSFQPSDDPAGITTVPEDVPDPAPLDVVSQVVIAPPPRRGWGRVVAALFFVSLLAVAAVGIVAGMSGLGMAIFWGGGPTVVVPEPSDPQPPEPTGDDDPVTPPGPAPQDKPPFQLDDPDAKPGVATVPTVLTFSDPAGAAITIGMSGSKFKATWDGRAPAEAALRAGEYKANVVYGGKTFRARTFTVDGAKAKCAFAFDATPGSEKWVGGCE